MFILIGDVVAEYKTLHKLGMIRKDLETADMASIELGLAGILSDRAVAKKKGENSHERDKRVIKETRFHNRILMDIGALQEAEMKWIDEVDETIKVIKPKEI